METRYLLIQRLADGKFHSGEGLAQTLGISRTAVWKYLKGLREQLGIDIHAVTGRGYCLPYPLDLLDTEKIMQALPAKTLKHLHNLEVQYSIDSTNAYLLRQAAAGASSGSVCMAEQQTAGRGRRGRHWVSPFGSNIYLSILWRYPLAPSELSGLSLAAGLAIMRALSNLGVTNVGLKWPNDILWQEQKLAGLLLEVKGESEGPSQVVLGVGLNTHLTHQQAKDISQPWVDLASISRGNDIERNRLAAELIQQLINALDSFGQEGLLPLLDEWHHHDLYYGKQVKLRMGDLTIEGVHAGVGKTGALLLSHGGSTRAYHAGEVSLRLSG
ncbi:Biotin operon repressor / Biotin--protein ligase [hydrothermal vent metagenome]|uniref:Biotin operon repressor / Biotin--protein ligase n=1 Tax=hydrothermal vent metagenome TaxID=652676 RepID=A0A3B1B465_9ZZZZ